jgi:phage nucleotide-binding protein
MMYIKKEERMIEIKKANGLAKSEGIKALIYAPSGAGKTTLLGTTNDKTLVLSFEKGTLSLNDASDNVDVTVIDNLGDLKNAFSYLKNEKHDYKTVGIDSLSELGEQIVAHLKRDPEFSSMKDGMKMWMKYSEMMLAISKDFRDLSGLNVILVALAETREENFVQKLYPMIPAQKVQLKLPALYDEVLYLSTDESGERSLLCQPTSAITAKDRSGKLEPTEEPNMANIFKKILGE